VRRRGPRQQGVLRKWPPVSVLFAITINRAARAGATLQLENYRYPGDSLWVGIGSLLLAAGNVRCSARGGQQVTAPTLSGPTSARSRSSHREFGKIAIVIFPRRPTLRDNRSCWGTKDGAALLLCLQGSLRRGR